MLELKRADRCLARKKNTISRGNGNGEIMTTKDDQSHEEAQEFTAEYSRGSLTLYYPVLEFLPRLAGNLDDISWSTLLGPGVKETVEDNLIAITEAVTRICNRSIVIDHDAVIGASLFSLPKYRQVAIKLRDDIPDEVKTILEENDYHWSKAHTQWEKKINHPYDDFRTKLENMIDFAQAGHRWEMIVYHDVKQALYFILESHQGYSQSTLRRQKEIDTRIKNSVGKATYEESNFEASVLEGSMRRMIVDEYEKKKYNTQKRKKKLAELVNRECNKDLLVLALPGTDIPCVLTVDEEGVYSFSYSKDDNGKTEYLRKYEVKSERILADMIHVIPNPE